MVQQIQAVISGERDAYCVDRVQPSRQTMPDFLLPGSFNPLHHGHRAMADFVAARQQTHVDFELSVRNVDKPTLEVSEVVDRLAQFGDDRVWVTRAQSFAEKAVLFPDCTFVVGADTAHRLFHLDYYPSQQDMLRAMRTIETQSCRFLVFSRRSSQGFLDATTLPIPHAFRDLFELIAESEFRIDICSTELRRKPHS